MKRSVFLLLTTILLASNPGASAHHSYGDFFLDRSTSIEGQLQQLRFANPHVILTVRADDSTVYTATWRSLAQLERSGVTRTTLKIGDQVIVTGAPPRNPASQHLMPLWEIRRPGDGWAWKHVRGPIRDVS